MNKNRPRGAQQSLRATIIWAFVATSIWAVVSIRFQDMPLETALWMTPFFFAILFFTMRATNRISTALVRRADERAARNAPPPKPPPQPSSERSEHVQRRRTARRPRGGTRRR